MSLLREIQSLAVSSENKISDLLRKCKILSARLSNREFQEWIDNELSGYKTIDKLPGYRIIKQVEIKGHFSGFFGSGLRNAIIPPSCIDESIRESLFSEYLMQGISVYEGLLKEKNEGSFQSSLPSDFIVYYGQRIYENMNCMAAWKVIPRGSVLGLVDDVRNRVLSFALEIEKVNPEAGEAAVNSEPIPQSSINQIFYTQIYGNVASISSESKKNTNIFNINVKGDFQGLVKMLRELGIENDDINSLEKAIQADKEGSKEEFGEKTSTWLSEMLRKTAKGLGKISLSVSTEVLPKLISNYFGLS